MKHKLNLDDFILDEIESIELHGEVETIDITVEDTELFFCNEIYTHNSASSAEIIKTDNMGGSIKKGHPAHLLIGLGKSLPQKENKRATISFLKNRMGPDGMVFNDCLFDNDAMVIDTADTMSIIAITDTREKELHRDALKHAQDKLKANKAAVNNN